MTDRSVAGQVMTVLGPVAPERLGAVLMHEHIYCDVIAPEEGPILPQNVELLRAYCAPFLGRLNDYGCHTLVDATPIPMRAEPWLYKELAQKANLHVILSTGFYREAAPEEAGIYLGAGVNHNWLDRRVLEWDVDALAGLMIREFEEGMRGSGVRPGIIKLASTKREFTPGEEKTFRAGAKAQRATGLCITTHAVGLVAEAQLDLLEQAGADPSRVILGHTSRLITETPWVARQLIRRGATLLPTNLRVDGPIERDRRLVQEIRRLFDDGYGDRLALGLDWAFANDDVTVIVGCSFMPPPPYIYMFTHTLPRFRELGLEEAAIEQMLVQNPARLLPIARQ